MEGIRRIQIQRQSHEPSLLVRLSPRRIPFEKRNDPRCKKNTKDRLHLLAKDRYHGLLPRGINRRSKRSLSPLSHVLTRSRTTDLPRSILATSSLLQPLRRTSTTIRTIGWETNQRVRSMRTCSIGRRVEWLRRKLGSGDLRQLGWRRLRLFWQVRC